MDVPDDPGDGSSAPTISTTYDEGSDVNRRTLGYMVIQFTGSSPARLGRPGP